MLQSLCIWCLVTIFICYYAFHSIPVWCDFIRWLNCHSLLHFNGFYNHAFLLVNSACNYWRLLCCAAVGYYNCNSGLIAYLQIVILTHYNACYVIMYCKRNFAWTNLMIMQNKRTRRIQLYMNWMSLQRSMLFVLLHCVLKICSPAKKFSMSVKVENISGRIWLLRSSLFGFAFLSWTNISKYENDLLGPAIMFTKYMHYITYKSGNWGSKS